MYKVIGILFCILEGVLVANFGWTAILWSTIGFATGLFISANMLLPIIMGIPIAFSLVRKKQMHSKVYLSLFRAPIIWFVVLFLIGFIFPSAAIWLSNNQTLNIGASFGTLAILLTPLSKKGRSDFREDFNKSWGKFFIQSVESKQVEALTRVFSNLYIHDFEPSFTDLNFSYLDSKFRCMIFCLSTAIRACESSITSIYLIKNECLTFLSNYCTLKDNVQIFFEQAIDNQEAHKRAEIYLNDFLKKWDTYFDLLKSGKKADSKNYLYSTILSIGIDESINENATKALDQIVWEIEFSIEHNTMRNAFINLIASSN